SVERDEAEVAAERPRDVIDRPRPLARRRIGQAGKRLAEWSDLLDREFVVETHAVAPALAEDGQHLGVAAPGHIHQVIVEAVESVRRIDDERPDAGLPAHGGEHRPYLA